MEPPTLPPRCYLVGLLISDFVIIDRLELSLKPGLCVLTGETGAGKSIIVDALGAALGERSSSEWVRAGAERSSIEAIFAFPETVPALPAILADLDIPLEEGTLILRRDIQTGRSLLRLNGKALVGRSADQIRGCLVDVHSQGDSVSLSSRPEQLAILDRFGRLIETRAQVTASVLRLRDARSRLQVLDQAQEAAVNELALLRYQLEELETVAPVLGEDEELLARRARLQNGLRLCGLVEQAVRSLFGDVGDPGALGLLEEADEALRNLRGLDSSAPLEEGGLLDTIDYVQTLQKTLQRYADSLEDDAGALEAIEDRLAQLSELKRKYGGTIEDILGRQEQLSVRLVNIEQVGQQREELAAEAGQLAEEVARLAEGLSEMRARAAGAAESAVQIELAQLGMSGCRFHIDIRRRSDIGGLTLSGGDIVAFDASGIDEVEFLVAVNPGEPERPIGRTASGGELSRLMLAVKSALAEADPVPVLIFDELDQGVGGRMGYVIGEKLWRLSRDRQVLCITHLPQVACYADHHYVVEKDVVDGRAITNVKTVEGSSRVDELAAMLAGPRAGAAAIQGAKELLDAAARWKEGER